MRWLLPVAIVATVHLGSPQAFASQVFDLDPNKTYRLDGPFDAAGGFVAAFLHFDAGFMGGLYLPPGFHFPQDQAGFEIDAAVSSGAGGASFWVSGSTNPGQGGSQTDGSLIIAESDPFLHVTPLSGVGWYSTSTVPYASYPLGNTFGDFTLELGDYGAPWSVTAVPEPSTWTMMLIGFVSFCALRFRSPLHSALRRGT